MTYYLKTNNCPLTNDHGDVIMFNSYSDARHFAINHCDLSDKELEICKHSMRYRTEMTEVIKSMREWLLECFPEEYDQEEINELELVEVIKAVDYYFDGGVKEFMNCYDNVEV